MRQRAGGNQHSAISNWQLAISSQLSALNSSLSRFDAQLSKKCGFKNNNVYRKSREGWSTAAAKRLKADRLG
jgi:hypothetical protein